MEEGFKYHIPEEIPANERTAFHGAAAAAAKSGKKKFNFGGKTHPVTMKKDTANAITSSKHHNKDDKIKKESTMTFREKLIAVLEGDRKAHYKSATPPEEYDEKSKSSKGAMDMMKNRTDAVTVDGNKAAEVTAKNATAKVPAKKMRSNDNNKGDMKIIPSATPMKGMKKTMEAYMSMKGKTDGEDTTS